MSLATVKDNHITFLGSRYFVANASTVSLGSLGEKATPIFGQNKLEVKTRVPVPRLANRVQVVPPVELDTKRSTRAEFEAAVSGTVKAVEFEGSKRDMYEALADRHLKFVQLFVMEEEMREAVNASPQARDRLADYGADGRIAHQLFVVMEARFASSFAAARSYSVSANGLGIVSVKAEGEQVVRGQDTVTLSPGTAIAYLLLKPHWNRERSRVDRTTVDEWSVN